MNVEVNRAGNEVTLSLTAEKTDLEPTVRSTYNRLRQDVEAKGFRPGKAPDNIIERELGAERIHAEVIDAVAEKLYRQAVEKEGLRPVGRPHVEVKKFAPYTELELEVKVEVMPEVELGDYKKLDVKQHDIEVDDSEVDNVLESLRDRLAERKEVDRAAKSGDEVVIDFHGTREGKDIPGAQAESYPLLLGANRFIPGFEEKVIGHKPGEEFDFKITFPKDYGEDSLAGKEVDFKVKLHKVNELELPEMNDELAKQAGPFESLENLKSDIRDHLRSEKEQQSQRQLENEVVSQAVDKAKVDLPQSMLEQERQRIENDFEKDLSEQGVSREQYLQQSGQTEKQHEKNLDENAERRVKTALVLTEIANQEKLEVTPEEMEVRLQVIAGQYNDDKVQEELQQPAVKREIANQMLAEKTVAKLVDYATKDEKQDKPKTKKKK